MNFLISQNIIPEPSKSLEKIKFSKPVEQKTLFNMFNKNPIKTRPIISKIEPEKIIENQPKTEEISIKTDKITRKDIDDLFDRLLYCRNRIMGRNLNDSELLNEIFSEYFFRYWGFMLEKLIFNTKNINF